MAAYPVPLGFFFSVTTFFVTALAVLTGASVLVLEEALVDFVRVGVAFGAAVVAFLAAGLEVVLTAGAAVVVLTACVAGCLAGLSGTDFAGVAADVLVEDFVGAFVVEFNFVAD